MREHEIAAFGDDNVHQQVVGSLVQRMASDSGLTVKLDWRSATGGHGRVVGELKRYLRRWGDSG